VCKETALTNSFTIKTKSDKHRTVESLAQWLIFGINLDTRRFVSVASLAELRTSTNKHVDDITRHAGSLQESLRRQAEDIKVELRRPQPLVFDEEDKLGG